VDSPQGTLPQCEWPAGALEGRRDGLLPPRHRRAPAAPGLGRALPPVQRADPRLEAPARRHRRLGSPPLRRPHPPPLLRPDAREAGERRDDGFVWGLGGKIIRLRIIPATRLPARGLARAIAGQSLFLASAANPHPVLNLWNLSRETRITLSTHTRFGEIVTSSQRNPGGRQPAKWSGGEPIAPMKRAGPGAEPGDRPRERPGRTHGIKTGDGPWQRELDPRDGSRTP